MKGRNAELAVKSQCNINSSNSKSLLLLEGGGSRSAVASNQGS